MSPLSLKLFLASLRQDEVRVLVLTPAGGLLLKRPCPQVWEVPGGAIDRDETPKAAR